MWVVFSIVREKHITTKEKTYTPVIRNLNLSRSKKSSRKFKTKTQAIEYGEQWVERLNGFSIQDIINIISEVVDDVKEN